MATRNIFFNDDHARLNTCFDRLEQASPEFPEALRKKWTKIKRHLIPQHIRALDKVGGLLDMNFPIKEEKDFSGLVEKMSAYMLRVEAHLGKRESTDGTLKNSIKNAVSTWNEIQKVTKEIRAYLSEDPCEKSDVDTSDTPSDGDPPDSSSTDASEWEDVDQEHINPQMIKLQSKFLYLQAAGSNGADGTSDGIHLRWTFRDKLAEEHLPKGSLASAQGSPFYTSIGHNRADDYVYVSRALYNITTAPVLDFHTPPDQIINTKLKKEWKYTLPGFAVKEFHVTVRFMNRSEYNNISIDPAVKPFNFIKAYDGIIEVQVDDSLMYAVEFTFKRNPKGCLPTLGSGPAAKLDLELISVLMREPGHGNP